jgi:hypothetical protein
MEAKLDGRARYPQFDPEFRGRLRALLAWRRDVRRFRRDKLPPGNRRIGPSSGIFASGTRRKNTIPQRSSAPIGKVAACGGHDPLSLRGLRRLESPSIKLHSVI